MASSVKMDQGTMAGLSVSPSINPSTAVPALFEFLDLKAQFGSIREEVMVAIARVMESQHFILGTEVR